MSTQLQNYDTTQDALTIFFDLQEEQNSIELWMNELFDEGQALYCKEEVAGEELFNQLQKLIRDGEALMPKSNRVLFCYYLPLENLSDKWIEDFFVRAETFKKYVPLENSFNQHYMICLSCATNRIPEDKHGELARLMIKLGTNNPLVSHQLYLLRIAGFQEYTSQEHAMVQLMHMLSRKDYNKIRQVKAGETETVKIIDYVDYYEDRATNCNEKIKALDAWEKEPNDIHMSKLVGAVKSETNQAVEMLRNASREFRKKNRVYPVRLSDFSGNIFSGYTCSVTSNHPILQKRREEYTERKRLELIENTYFTEPDRIVEEEYHYPDYEELNRKIESGTLKMEIIGKTSDYEHEPEVLRLLESLFNKLKKKLVSHTADLDESKKKKQREKRRYVKELQMAGQYKDIEDCFSKINEDIKPSPINGRFLQLKMTIALISGKPLENWNTNMYDIKDIHQIYKYPAIKPSEIVVINESDLLNLNDEDAERVLMSVF